MKLGTLDLTLYMAAAVLAQSAQAEYIAQSQAWQRPAIASAKTGAPMNLAPDVEPNSLENKDEPRIGADRGNEPEVKKWLEKFDLVVVIDKAASKQTLVAYRNLGTPDNVILDATIKTHVSTGVETRDCHYVKSMTRDTDGNIWYTKVKPIYKHTPTGYYVPKNIDADHYSSTYDASHMKNAVGWYSDDGFWTHEHPPGTKAAIGHRASHGCIRMYAEDAQDLFTMVLMTGGQFDPGKDANLRARCPQDPDSNIPCTPNPAVSKNLEKYFTSVENGNYPLSMDPKHPRDLKSHMPRLSPHEERPDVLVVKKNGELDRDSQTHEVKTQKAYNTLYIVKDSDIGTPRETAVPPPVTCPTLEEANADLAAKRGVSPPGGATASTNSNDPIGDFFTNLFNPNRGSAPSGQQRARTH